MQTGAARSWLSLCRDWPGIRGALSEQLGVLAAKVAPVPKPVLRGDIANGKTAVRLIAQCPAYRVQSQMPMVSRNPKRHFVGKGILHAAFAERLTLGKISRAGALCINRFKMGFDIQKPVKCL